MRALWDGNTKKFYYWMKVELAVIRAREILHRVPEGTTKRIAGKLKMTPEIARAIERRDKLLEHDLNAFIEIMRIMIVLSRKEFFAIIRIEDYNKFNEMVTEALKKCKGNSDASVFHDGMTSYDTEEPAMAILFWESWKIIDAGLARLERVLIVRVKQYRGQLMIGRTHGQHAQPITFGIKIINWLDAVQRAQKAIRQAAKDYRVMKLSGAVGVYGALDPELESCVGKILKLRPVIATQIVAIDYRERLISEIATASEILFKVANDLWLMMKTEDAETREHFTEKQKGSSAMMHKKNPIRTERVRGITVLIFGFSVAMKRLISTSHERDISHSSAERLIAMDVFSLFDYQVDLLATIIEKMDVFPENMLKNLNSTYGVIASQKLEMLFKEKGMPAELAYRTVQKACYEAIESKTHLREVIISSTSEFMRPVIDLAESGKLSLKEIKAVFDWKEWIKEEDYIYHRAGIA